MTYNLNNQGLTNDFTLESGNNINININGDFTNSKDLLSNANLSLNTNGNSIINNANHTISADNEINLSGSSLENNGIISAKKGTSNLEFTDEITNNSRISSAENLIISGLDITNNGAINSGIDLSINANNIVNNQTIFSNNNMNLYVANNLTNNQNSNIFAMKDLIIAKNSSHEKTNLIENISANIESYEGDINIWATTLNNKNPQNLSELYTYQSQTERKYFSSISPGRRSNGSIFYLGQDTGDGYHGVLNNYSLVLWMDHNGNHESGSLTVTLNIPVLRNNITGLASIYSGNDLNLTVDTINNELSKISSANNIHFDTNSLVNKSGSYNGTVRWAIDKCDGTAVNTYCGNTSSWMQRSGSYVRIGQLNDRESSTFNYTLTDVLSFASTIQAQGSITGSINQVNNGTIVQNQNLSTITQQSADTSTKTVGTNSLSSQTLSNDLLPTSEYGLFILSKDPTSDYLIETNSEFTNRDKFLSSNYMLERIGFSPDEHVKRLGDGLYEQRLVSDQIFVQTGRAFLDDTYTNNQSQYQYLMDNAVDVSQDINLVAGVALTKEQIEALKVDIVWMEEKIINGQKVLAPQVYIANINSFELKNGQILAKKDIDLEVKQIDNKGNIKSSQDIKILAQNDIRNISGTIQANNISLQSIQGSIINERSVEHIRRGQALNKISFSSIGKQASIEAKNGNLIIEAQKDIINKAGNLKSSESINLSTQEGNIKLLSQKAEESQDTRDDKGFRKSQKITQLQSNIQAGEEIVLNSAKAITIEATKLKTQDNITINAQEDINILASNNVDYQDNQSTEKKKFGRSKTTRNMSYEETVVGSELEASNINLNSAKSSINLESVNFQADANINAKAKENVNITAKQYKEGSLSYTKKKGFGGLSSSSSTNQIENLNLKESKLTISKDDINISEGINLEGENINIIASSIDAKNKNLNIKALDEFNIIGANEIKRELHKEEKQGFNIGGSLKGLVTLGQTKSTIFEIKENKDTLTSNVHKSSKLNANNITIDSGSTNIIGSNVQAINDVIVKANSGDVNIVNAFNEEELAKSENTTEIYIGRSSGNGSFSIKAALEYDKEELKTVKKTVASSTINAKNLKIESNDKLNIVSTNINVDENIDATAKHINILSAKDTIETRREHENAEINIKLSLDTNIKEGLKATINTIKMIGDGSISDTLEGVKNMVENIAKGNNPLDGSEKAINNVNSLNNNMNTLQGGPSVSSGLTVNLHLEKTKSNILSSTSVENTFQSNNISFKTTKGDMNLEGVNVNASDTLTLDSKKDINVIASSDTTQSDSKTDTFDGTYNIISQDVTLSANQDKANSTSTSYNNSKLLGNNVIIKGKDSTLEGVNVKGDNINMDVDNLTVTSLQDTQNSSSSSKGITVGTSTMGANLSNQNENKNWTNNQSDIIGENVTINTNNKTTLNGSIIASQDKDGDDNNNLNLTTNQLEVNNLTDTHKAKTQGLGINGNADKSITNLNYAKLDKEQILKGTLGNGNIQINDKINSTKLSEVNRDIANTQEITKDKEIEAIGVTITQKSEETKKKESENSWSRTGERLGQGVSEALTNIGGSKEDADKVASVVENGYESVSQNINKGVSKVVSLGTSDSSTDVIGIIPNQKNHGGISEQIIASTSDSDRDRKQISVISINNSNYDKLTDEQKAQYTKIEETEYFQSLPEDKQKELKDKGLVITTQKTNASFQNFTNGMMNSVGEAIMNGLTQTHDKDSIDNDNINFTINYNPTRGLISDGVESAQDKLNLTSGMAKDTGEFVREVTNERGADGSNFAKHSQGSILFQKGVEYIEEKGSYEQGGFDNEDHFEDKKGDINLPTSAGYGSPVNIKDMKKSLEDTLFEDGYKGMFTNPKDAVGEVIGGNEGDNDNIDTMDRIESIPNVKKLFEENSPHSNYNCEDKEGAICGDK